MKYFYYTVELDDHGTKELCSGVIETNTGMLPVSRIIKNFEAVGWFNIKIIYSTEITSDEYKELV